jgi:ubiquinone/menaquinone biosynthesis C-methylase UbiE
MPSAPPYLPALSFRFLTPLYDPLLRWAMREDRFKRQLVGHARLEGSRVLDLGCGTGTLTVMAKQAHPDIAIIGLDLDAEMLARARSKASRAGWDIRWDEGRADRLPYPDGSFDRVLASLVFHHLTTEDRRRVLLEVRRVLRSGGELHIADYGPPRSAAMICIAAVLRHFEQTADLFDGKLPGMLAEVGFVSVDETARVDTLFGPLVLLCAKGPASRGCVCGVAIPRGLE